MGINIYAPSMYLNRVNTQGFCDDFGMAYTLAKHLDTREERMRVKNHLLKGLAPFAVNAVSVMSDMIVFSVGEQPIYYLWELSEMIKALFEECGVELNDTMGAAAKGPGEYTLGLAEMAIVRRAVHEYRTQLPEAVNIEDKKIVRTCIWCDEALEGESVEERRKRLEVEMHGALMRFPVRFQLRGVHESKVVNASRDVIDCILADNVWLEEYQVMLNGVKYTTTFVIKRINMESYIVWCRYIHIKISRTYDDVTSI